MDSLVGWNDEFAVEKPEAGEQVTVTPSEGQGLDLTAIAALDAQFYQTGSNLWIVFEDGAILVVEGYFEGSSETADGTPRSVVVDGEPFTGEEFLTAFAIDELPEEFAEGETGDAGPQQNGTSFDDPALGDLGPNGQGLGLLGNTNLSRDGAAFDEEGGNQDTDPTLGVADIGAVDDDDLVTDGQSVFTGSLAVDFGNNDDDTPDGADLQDTPTGFGDRSITFDSADVGSAVPLSSGGTPLTFTLSNGGTVLTASAGGVTVFEVSLFDDGAGSYRFTLFEPLDHPDATSEDDLGLTFSFTATDDDGDSVSGTFLVNVNDDVPEVGESENTVVDEASVGDAEALVGRLVGAASQSPGGVNGSVMTTGPGNQTAQIDPVTGTQVVQFINGSDEPLLFEFFAPNGDVVASAMVDAGTRAFVSVDPSTPGGTTLKLRYSDDGGLTWTVKGGTSTLRPDDSEQQDFEFGDADLTFASGSLNIAWGADDFDDPDSATAQDTPDGVGDRSVTFDSTATGVSLTSDQVDALISVNGGSIPASTLTSNGVPLEFSLSADGTVLTASANGEEVFSVTLSDDGDGSYEFALNGNLDHPVKGNGDEGRDDLDLEFDFVATDSDGDTDTGDFTVTVTDDIPEVKGQINNTVDEDDILTDSIAIPGQNEGSEGTSPNDNDGDGSFTGDPNSVDNGPANVSGTLADIVDFGADGAAAQGAFSFIDEGAVRDALNQLGLTSDGASLSYSIETNGSQQVLYGFDDDTFFGDDFDDSGFFQDRLVFRLTLNEDGSYEFELFDQLDHVEPAPGSADENTDLANDGDPSNPAPSIDFGSLIEATDGDGDTIGLGDGTFTIEITDDIPVVNVDLSGRFLTVDETPGRQTSNGADDVNSLTSALNNFISASGGSVSAIAAARDDLVNVLNSVQVGADESITEFDIALTKSDGSAFAGEDSGLTDTATGYQIFLFTEVVNGEEIVVGRLGDGNGNPLADGQPAFALDIEGDGDVTIAQFRAIEHDDENSNNENVEIDGLHVTISVTDQDGDTVSDTSDELTVRIRDDGPTLVGQENRTVDEDDILTDAIAIPGQNEGSEGTSPNDNDGDGSFTGDSTLVDNGPANISGSLATIVNFGADGAAAQGAFSFIDEGAVRDALNQLGLTSDGASLSYSIETNGSQQVLYGFDDDTFFGDDFDDSGFFQDRLVFRLTLNEDGSYEFELFDQIDHVEPAPGSADENTDLANEDDPGNPAPSIDFGSLIEATDGDGDTVTLDDNFTITITDDIPVVDVELSGRSLDIDETPGNQTGEEDRADADPLPDTLQGFINNNGGNGSVIAVGKDDLVNVVNSVQVGADENIAAFNIELTKSDGSNFFGEDSGLVDTATGNTIFLFTLGLFGPGPDEQIVVGRVGDDVFGEPAFALDIDAAGNVTIVQFRAIEHGNENSDNESVEIDGLHVTIAVTDQDGDTVSDTSDDAVTVRIRDDAPTVVGQENRTVDEDDILTDSIAIPGQNEGSAGTSPNDNDGDGSFTGDPNQIDNGPANITGSLAGIVNFGADGGRFSVIGGTALRDTLNQFGLKSKGESLSFDVDPSSNGQVLFGFVGSSTGDRTFDDGDRLVFRLALNEDGSYEFELFDQLDHEDAVGDPTDSIVIDFGKVVEATDGDGDTATLDDSFTITITDDIPVVDVELSGRSLDIDETPGNQTGEEDRADPLPDTLHNFIDANGGGGSVISAGTDDLVNVANSFEVGADENATVAVSLTTISGDAFDGDDSGLVDTATGYQIFLFTEVVNGEEIVVGRLGDGNGTYDPNGEPAFALDIDNGGDVTIAQLRAIEHGNTNSDNESVGIDGLHVTIAVTDQDGDTVRDTSDDAVTVRIRDDGPVALDDMFTAEENTPLVISIEQLLSNDSFGADGPRPSGGLRTITGITPQGGSVFVSVDNGTITYTPPANFVGTDTIEYTIIDGDGDVSDEVATVTFTIEAASNDAPTANADTVITNIVDGSDIEIPDFALLANDSDPDGDSLTIPDGSLTNPSGGAVAPGVVFTPDPGDIQAPSSGTTTYTFAGKTAGAGDHLAKRFEVDISDSTPLTGTGGNGPLTFDGPGSNGFANSAELTTSDYASLTGSDNDRFATPNPGNGDNAVLWMQFDVAETPETITRIDISVEVSQGGSFLSPNEQVELGVWNHDTDSWERLDGRTSQSDGLLEGSITTDPADYLGPDGKVTIVVFNEEDDGDRVLIVDDVSLSVSFDDPGTQFEDGSFEYSANDGTVDSDSPATVTIDGRNTQTLMGSDDDDIILANNQDTVLVGDAAVMRAVRASVASGSTANSGAFSFSFLPAAALAGLFITDIEIDISSVTGAEFDQQGFNSQAFQISAGSDVTNSDVDTVTSGDTTVLTISFDDDAFTQGEELIFRVDTDPNFGSNAFSSGVHFANNSIPFKVTFSDGTTLEGNYASDGANGATAEVSDLIFTGTGGDDVLVGGDGDDMLFGGGGDDILWGGLGKDTMTGGEGNDTFIISDLSDVDIITDYTEGEDKIDLTALLAGVTLTDANKAEYVRVQNGVLQVDVDGGGDSFVDAATLNGVANGQSVTLLDNTDTTAIELSITAV